MKKLVALFAVVGLTLTGLFGMPLQSSAETSHSDSEVQYAASKKVNVTRYFSLNASIPSSIVYNLGGWSGTLSRVSYKSTGNEIIAHYSGTVYCSGPCAMSKSVGSE